MESTLSFKALFDWKLYGEGELLLVEESSGGEMGLLRRALVSASSSLELQAFIFVSYRISKYILLITQ